MNNVYENSSFLPTNISNSNNALNMNDQIDPIAPISNIASTFNNNNIDDNNVVDSSITKSKSKDFVPPAIRLQFPPVVDLVDLISKKSPDGRIPARAPNAFIIYRKVYVETARKNGHFLPMTTISSMASQSWENEKEEVKVEYRRVAKEALKVRNEMYPKAGRRKRKDRWNIVSFEPITSPQPTKQGLKRKNGGAQYRVVEMPASTPSPVMSSSSSIERPQKLRKMDASISLESSSSSSSSSSTSSSYSVVAAGNSYSTINNMDNKEVSAFYDVNNTLLAVSPSSSPILDMTTSPPSYDINNTLSASFSSPSSSPSSPPSHPSNSVYYVYPSTTNSCPNTEPFSYDWNSQVDSVNSVNLVNAINSVNTINPVSPVISASPVISSVSPVNPISRELVKTINTTNNNNNSITYMTPSTSPTYTPVFTGTAPKNDNYDNSLPAFPTTVITNDLITNISDEECGFILSLIDNKNDENNNIQNVSGQEGQDELGILDYSNYSASTTPLRN